MRRRRSAIGAITLLLGVIAPIGIGGTPAGAAAACSVQDVTVVVDYGSLGSPVTAGCAQAQGNAASLFLAAGFNLRYAQQAPGAVCQVQGQPADSPCQQMPPANAYWGLFWTDGTTSRWTYSAFGVQSLTVPAGGSVAFAWQQSTATRYPAFAPAVTQARTSSAPKPSRQPRRTRSPHPRPTPTTSAASAKVSASPSASASATGPSTPSSPTSTAVTAYTGSAVPLTQSPSPSPSSAPRPTSASTDNGGGLPAWVPVGLIGVLVLGAGVIVAVRRRT